MGAAPLGPECRPMEAFEVGEQNPSESLTRPSALQSVPFSLFLRFSIFTTYDKSLTSFRDQTGVVLLMKQLDTVFYIFLGVYALF